MAWLLSIETSTTVCSAALHEDGQLRAVSSLHIPQSAASKLAVIIQQIMESSGITAKEIGAVAVSSGPGSYTGLRIGVATAKGFCYALGVPLIAVNTLELITQQVKEMTIGDTVYCPMIDARRMEVYCMLLDKSMKVLQPTEASVIEAGSFEEWLDRGRVTFFGNGAAKCKEVLLHPNASFLEGVHPSAGTLGQIAYQKWLRGQFEELDTFEPLYLKDFLIRKPKSEA